MNLLSSGGHGEPDFLERPLLGERILLNGKQQTH